MAEQIIQASKIDTFSFCPHAYFLDTIIRETELPMSGFMAKKFWLKNAFRKLFPDQRHVGEDLIDIESIPLNELPDYLNYKSPEAFGNYHFRGWHSHVIENKGKVHNRNVVWLYKNQWWKEAHAIKKVCQNYYQYLLDNGLPIIDFIDKEVAFYFKGRKYIVRFNEIRNGLIIGEQGTKSKKQKEIDSDFKITLQLLAFCTLAHAIEPYRMKFNVPEELAKSWDGNPTYIDPQLKYIYNNLSKDNQSENNVLETTRSDADLEIMIEEINRAEQAITRREFIPNYGNCSVCRYNVLGSDNTSICKERDPDIEVLMPMEHFENTD